MTTFFRNLNAKSYKERARERREAQSAPTNQVTPFQRTGLTYARRAAQRRAEDQGKAQAESIRRAEEKARRQAERDAIPEHLRRPNNIWRDLIAQWESRAYDPQIRAKLAEYARRAQIEDKRIDALMEEKQRRYALENDPQVKSALEHHSLASQFASDDEREEWALAKGLIEGGALSEYWDLAFGLTEKAREREEQRLNAEADKLGSLKSEYDEAAQRLDVVLESARQGMEALKATE